MVNAFVGNWTVADTAHSAITVSRACCTEYAPATSLFTDFRMYNTGSVEYAARSQSRHRSIPTIDSIPCSTYRL